MVVPFLAFMRLSKNTPFFTPNAAPVRHQISPNAAPPYALRASGGAASRNRNLGVGVPCVARRAKHGLKQRNRLSQLRLVGQNPIILGS